MLFKLIFTRNTFFYFFLILLFSLVFSALNYYPPSSGGSWYNVKQENYNSQPCGSGTYEKFSGSFQNYCGTYFGGGTNRNDGCGCWRTSDYKVGIYCCDSYGGLGVRTCQKYAPSYSSSSYTWGSGQWSIECTTNCAALTWYHDADNDGYGNNNSTISSCTQPTGYILDNSDCDDSSFAIKPGAVEICDGKDNDCDNLIDEGLFDLGSCVQLGVCSGSKKTCSSGIWSSCSIVPSIEVCNGVDDDCDGSIDEGCPFGYLDSASCEGGLVGWARDSRAANGTGITDDAVALSNALDVHFYYVLGNGPVSTTNIYMGEVLANLDSIDVGSHRFNKSIIIPGAVVGNKYTFGAWGINVGGFSIGNPSLTNNKTLTINSEICDGWDNDCDGVVDEGLSEVSSGCNQIGVCVGAVRSCVEGDWSVCSIVPSEELCDYLDNDCDGVVDDAVDCLAVPCHNCSSLESLINIDTLGAVFTSNNIVLDLNIFCDVSSIDGTKVVNVNSVLVKKNDEVVPAVLSAPVLGCNIVPVMRQVVVGDCEELNYVVSFGFDSNEPYCFDANNCLGLDSVLSVVDCASSDFKWNGLKVSTGVAEVGGSQNISDGSIYSALIIILGIFFLTTKKKE